MSAAGTLDDLETQADRLSAKYDGAAAETIIEAVLKREFTDRRVALVSSFGAESAVLIHLAASIDPGVEVIMVDTGKLFGETRRYRNKLAKRLGLTNLTVVKPLPDNLQTHDAAGALWSQEPNACCFWRKVEPLERALTGVDVWFSGRKRFQATSRTALPTFEAADGRLKVNPLAGWSRDDLLAHFERHDLPRHPLEAEGYLSIGCMPCTDKVKPGEDVRSGRWRGIDKTECGIHMSFADQRKAATAAQ